MAQTKGSGDRQGDAFEEIPVTAPDLAEFPARQCGTASAMRTISVGMTLASDGTTVIPANGNLATKVDEDSVTEDVYYIGKAPVGTATSAAGWQLKRITVTEISNKTAVDVEWADGNDKFDNVYDDRQSKSYS